MADHKQKSAASGSTTTGSATTGKSTMDKNTTDKNTITATATTTATAVSATSTKADLSTSNSAAPMAAPSLTSKRGSGGGGKKKREAATTTAATTAGVVDVTAGVAAIGLSGGAAYEAAATGATGTTTAATGTTTGTTSGNRRGSRRGSGRGSASVERGHGAGASAGTSGAGTTAGTATHGHHGPARANGHGQGQPAMTSSDRRLAAAIAAGLVVQVQPMDPTLGEREMMEILAVSEPATVAEVNDGSEAAVPATTAAATTTAATTATASHDVDAPTDANRDTTTTSVEEVVTHRPTRVDFFGVYALATYADHTLAQRAITAHNGRAMYRDLTFTVAWPRPGGGPFYVGGGGHGVGSAISGHSSPAFRGGPMAYGASPGPYGTPGSYGTGPYGYGAPRYGGVSPTPYGGSGQRDDGSVKGQQQHQHQFSDGGPPRGRGFPSRQDSEVFSSRGGAQRRMFKNRVWIGDLDGSTDEAQLVAELKEDFPSLYDCRIMMDRATGVSRGYGFVSFQDRADAERLLKETRRIQGKAVRLNWAFDGDRFGTAPGSEAGYRPGSSASDLGRASMGPSPSAMSLPYAPTPSEPLDYDTVLKQAPADKTTVYVGGIPTGTTEENVLSVFREFGAIIDYTFHIDRGFAFLRYDLHANAAVAITRGHGLEFEGQRLRCAWGRDRMSIPRGMGGPSRHSPYGQQFPPHAYRGAPSSQSSFGGAPFLAPMYFPPQQQHYLPYHQQYNPQFHLYLQQQQQQQQQQLMGAPSPEGSASAGVQHAQRQLSPTTTAVSGPHSPMQQGAAFPPLSQQPMVAFDPANPYHQMYAQQMAAAAGGYFPGAYPPGAVPPAFMYPPGGVAVDGHGGGGGYYMQPASAMGAPMQQLQEEAVAEPAAEEAGAGEEPVVNE